MKDLIAAWKKFRKLSPDERRLLLQALCLLPITALALRILGLSACRAFLLRRIPRRRVSSDLEVGQETAGLDGRAIVRVFTAACRHNLYRGSCLERAMLLCWLLRREGLPAELCLGARKEGTRFEAHAWVEWLGRAFDRNDCGHEQFVPFRDPSGLLKAGKR